MRHTRHQQRAQSGQAAVLISLCLFSMVVFLALATNMGILVNDRVRMQNTADLAAYAGAFEEARALNRMTWLNHRIYGAAYDIRKHLTCKDWPDLQNIPTDETEDCNKSGLRVFPDLTCEQKLPKGILKVGQLRMDILAATFQVENFRSKETSFRAAEFTAQNNFRGTGRPRHANFYNLNQDSPTFRLKPLEQVVRKQTTFTYAYFHIPGTCGCPLFSGFPPRPKFCVKTASQTLDTWFIKEHPGPTVYFPARVQGTPQKEFLDIKTRRGGYFGGDAARGILRGSDDLWAFAVAKPYGGNLGSSDSQGRRKHLHFKVGFGPIKGSADTNGYDYDSFDDFGLNSNFIEKYRARMAGIKDKMMKDEPGPIRDDPSIRPLDLMMREFKEATFASENEIDEYIRH